MPDTDHAAAHDLTTGRKLRATINLGNIVLAQRGPARELQGVTVELARELARRLSVEAELKPFETAGAAFAALQAGECDIGFLAIDPARAEALAFTSPYVIIEGTYLVREGSPFSEVEELDRPGIRIAAGKNTAYDLHLSRSLKQASLVHAPSSQEAIDLFLSGATDAVAGVRQPLTKTAVQHAGYKVLPGRFLVIEQAMALPRNKPRGAAYLQAFIEEMKRDGFVASALQRSGQHEATVAPPS
jgi:polar amino acid transport system substrate-binding protein